MSARVLAALAQGLFVSVASQVAIAAVPEGKQTAAIATVVNGIALSTALGVPVGTLIGQSYGWRVVPAGGDADRDQTGRGAGGRPHSRARTGARCAGQPARVREADTLLGLATTVLAFTGMITAFTYVAPTLMAVTGFSPTWVTGVLRVYGVGTIVGNTLAGLVSP
jgi:DHA1 family inner membrane transport protein